MKTINKLIITSIVLLTMFVLPYMGIGQGIARAATSGSLLFSYDYDGGGDPDCWTAQDFCVYWGDGVDADAAPSQWNFCLAKAEQYAVGTDNPANYNFNVVQSGRDSMCAGAAGEKDKTYATYVLYYSPKCTANASQKCVGNSIYYFDSCGTQGSLVQTCTANQTCTGDSCTNSCTPNSQQRCVGNNLYYYDSCGNQGSLIQYCPNGCTNNSCQSCTPNYQQKCIINELFWYDSCGGQGAYIGNCQNQTQTLCTPNYQQKCVGNELFWYDSCGGQGAYIGNCQNQTSNCTSNSQQRCSGNNLYWYDSCGNQQNFIQYCPNGCNDNSCGNNNYNYNYNTYGNCTYHAYKFCSGNNIYWYDSCGTQQDLYSTCNGGQTCQYGQCATNVQPYIPSVTNYVAHYRTKCYNNSLYWYDSLGANDGLYRSCADSNSCTIDTCVSDDCVNTLKCDGSTCAVGSAEYNTYCSSNNTTSSALSISFFAKLNQSATAQWQKSIDLGSNGQVYFLVSVLNNSTTPADNVNLSANIPTEITSLGNLQINGVPTSGDIVSGVNIGSLAPSVSKSITFEGRTQTISAQATKQAIVTTNVSGSNQSDNVSINLTTGQVAGAAVSATPATSGFMGFLKRWYLWIIVALVMIFLFVVVFRRLSSNA